MSEDDGKLKLKQITNRLDKICRNILLLDIQKLSIAVGYKLIQIGIITAIPKADPTFCRPVPHTSQKHTGSKVVLKLETRSSINFKIKFMIISNIP